MCVLFIEDICQEQKKIRYEISLLYLYWYTVNQLIIVICKTLYKEYYFEAV